MASRTQGGTIPGPPSSWPDSAQLAYSYGVGAGLTPQQATDFAAAQYGESGFNPNALNKSSGAAGLYQLLSSGFVNLANKLGGVFNPNANIQAILPNYVDYYQTHPGAVVPGAAAAAVEASGEPASYYAQGNAYLAQRGSPSTSNPFQNPATGLPQSPSSIPGISGVPVSPTRPGVSSGGGGFWGSLESAAGWAGSEAEGLGSAAYGAAGSLASQAADSITGPVSFLKAAVWLLSPLTWLRFVEGVIGFALLGGAVAVAVKADQVLEQAGTVGSQLARTAAVAE